MIFRPASRRLSALCLALTVSFALSACSSPGSGGSSPRVERPRPDAQFDYQIGGAYKPPAGVRAVSRDRGDAPARGLYNVCYVNAFQAQPGAVKWWRAHHDDLLLRDGEGKLVVDADWHEPLFDISTNTKRARLANIVGGWIRGCADDGYQAVEPDNLDSYERSDGLLDSADAVAFARLISDRSHGAGLAVGQKNAAELLPERRDIGFDFAVTEECQTHDECRGYASAYDDRVFAVEYREADFERACRAWGDRLSIVLRDMDVRPAGTKGYVRRAC
ncbi:endo alpha-1,4 polygalactosaminidase [Streptomyces endophyticus]|uniref:Endo alpha-1,4 polygalactosaminidase n=1 Tax=Streptomyces endophyticus TaxID=714166 RepID=A0ABU6FJS9_9ACTN|nr:endo alpha-1,4 polygalactosaminidase [Streptomyces endophyticus]MEB8344208.1 endo alpha-1,4 polygalactosaminidase [Streptomyces endophyticus]